MGWSDQLRGRETKHADADMELILPGRWRASRESDHLSFVKEAEQLTVAAFHAKDPLDMPTLLVAVLELVRARQDAMRELSGTELRLSEIQTEYVAGGMNVSYTATDPSHAVQVYSVTIGRPTRVVTFTYNNSSSPLSPEPVFVARGQALQAGLRVHP